MKEFSEIMQIIVATFLCFVGMMKATSGMTIIYDIYPGFVVLLFGLIMFEKLNKKGVVYVKEDSRSHKRK